MKIITDTKAETPIEVMFVVMTTILAMALLMLSMGTFIDSFMSTVNAYVAANPLGSWGTAMFAALPIAYAEYVFLVPPFMILLVLIWGIKTVIKKHTYSTAQDQEFMDSEF